MLSRERHLRDTVLELEVLARIIDDVEDRERVRLLLAHLEVAA